MIAKPFPGEVWHGINRPEGTTGAR